MTEYFIEKGPEYNVLEENTVHKREIDALIGKKFNSIEGILTKLAEPLHIRPEDAINLSLLTKFPICYKYSPDYEVATVKVS